MANLIESQGRFMEFLPFCARCLTVLTLCLTDEAQYLQDDMHMMQTKTATLCTCTVL